MFSRPGVGESKATWILTSTPAACKMARAHVKVVRVRKHEKKHATLHSLQAVEPTTPYFCPPALSPHQRNGGPTSMAERACPRTQERGSHSQVIAAGTTATPRFFGPSTPRPFDVLLAGTHSEPVTDKMQPAMAPAEPPSPVLCAEPPEVLHHAHRPP